MDKHQKRLIGIYLNDHLAFLTGAEQLALRTRSNNSGKPVAGYLGELVSEIRSDAHLVRLALTSVSHKESRVKVAMAKLGEKAGRLKLNGRLRGYSPLSRVVELQQLLILRKASESLWDTLTQLQEPLSIESGKLDKHIESARNSQMRLQEFLAKAVPAAFGP